MRPMSRTKKTTKIRYWMGTKQGPVQKDWKTHRTRHWRHQDEDQDKDKKQDANQIKTMYPRPTMGSRVRPSTYCRPGHGTGRDHGL